MNKKEKPPDKRPVRKHHRLNGFCYAEIGAYFITNCVKEGTYPFGRVVDNKMDLTKAGQIAADQFKELPEFYKSISIDSFVVMPNHVHAIVKINDFIPGRSIPNIMQAYKSMCTRKIRAIGLKFDWQRSYYDSIIRDGAGIERITEYIQNNPANWHKDAENRETKLDIKKYYDKLVKGK